MQTTPKANNILGHFFALLGAVVMLAIATWVSASSSEQVQPLDNLATPRTGHTATPLSDGRILITGGRDTDGNLVAASEIFDPETQTSGASGTLHTARVDHSATVLADGRVLVAGGTGASGALSSAEIFDPAYPENGFVPVGSAMSTARTRHTATLLNSGMVLIAGGDAQGSAELFDRTTQAFLPTIWPLTVARSGHTATLFTDDNVLLAGGNTATLETYTPNRGFTLDPAMMSVVRTGQWAFELSDTRLLLFQGDVGNTIDEFNPTAGTITPKGNLDFHASSSTLLVNGKVLVLGTDVSGLYDPDATPPAPDFIAFDETSVPNSGILPRSGQSAITLPGDKKILIAGGLDGNNQLLGQALFNPAKIWTDKDDYQPDEPVILSGSGWKGNENIYLYAVDNETEQWTYEMTVPVDANGEFVLSPYFIVELRHLGVQFHVTALGAQSTMQADVYFTDANPGTMTLSPPSVSVSAGSIATYTATIAAGGNNNPCTLTLSFAYTGTPPVGTTPSFTPNPLTMTTSNVSSTLTITTTNTGAPAGRTQPGTYNFTVTAARGANCQGSGNIVASGTLVVTGPSPTPTATATATATATPTATATATPANSTLTVTAASGTYGGTTTFTATLASAGGVSGKAINFTRNGTSVGTATTNGAGVATLSGVSLCSVNAQTYPTGVGASFTGDTSVAAASGSNFLTVGKANATVVVTPYDVPYNGSSHTATVTAITGVCGETGATVGTVDVTGTTHVLASGSPYTDTWSFTATGNYNNIAAGPATTIIDKINKINATWTTNPASKTYGDADPVPLTTGSGSGFVPADAALLAATYSRVSGETVLGGPYHITATLGPADVVANYNITNTGANFTINTRPATWTTNPASKTYGDADPVPLTTGSGDFLAADGVTATYTRVAAETVLAGPYHITATLSPAAVLTNYSITNTGASFTINTRPATWTTNPASKAYGDADPNPLTTGSGDFLAADGVTATYTRDSGETVLGGPYHITATLSPAAVLSNYSVTNTGASFTINTRPATWTTNPASKTYGDADPSPLTTGSGSGFLAADNVTASYSRVAGETVLGGPYHITATLSPAAVLTNYNITNTGAAFTIDTRPATWTTNPASKTYGDADPVPLTTGSGDFLPADGVTAAYTRVAGETVLGGPYHITATLSPAGVLSNYSITNAGASFTIDARPATWTTNPASKTYGDADPVPLTTGSGSGFLAADNVTASYSRAAGETVLGGPYHITATLGPAAVLSNYSITNAGASFTIDARPATWTTNPATKIYGDADANPLTTGSGNFLATDNVTASYSRDPGETVLGGPYHITATLSPAGVLSNYSITNTGASFTIDARPATWTINPASKIYGNADPNPLTTGSGSGFLLADNVTATYSRASGETVLGGPYHITANLAPAGVLSNYTITNSGANFTINTRPATWTTNPASKTYGIGDPNPLTTGSGSNFVAADNVTATYSRMMGETVAGSPYHITATLSPAGVLSNYSITNNGANFTIDPATLTITAANRSKVFGTTYTPDTTPPSVDFSVNGLVTGDSVASVTLSSAGYASGATVGSPGPIYTVSISAAVGTGLGNYTINYVNGTLTVNKAHLMVTADNKSVQYSDLLPTLTASISGFVPPDTVAVVTGSPAFSTTAAITFTNTGGVSNAPGSYTNAIVPSVGTLNAANYDFPAANFVRGALTVTLEDARPYYTGSMFVSTSGPNSFTATVTLSATIKDITAVNGDPAYDAYAGDIRNAKVTFINRDNNTVIAANLPVGLVNQNDTTVGTTTYNWTVTIPTNAAPPSQTFTIGIKVTNYYTRDSSDDDAVVIVAQPQGAGSITGGGYLAMQRSAGQYPGGVGTKNNYGFNVQNTRTGVKGNINTIIRNNGRTYQVKGNSMTSLTVNTTINQQHPYPTATFNGKSNVQDITDPLHPISLEGNATLQVTMTDRGEPGTNDSVGIAVWGHTGAMLFSSNWDGTQTVEQTIGGGNLQVH